MFTSDHVPTKGENLGFYGNDGVCLFKYFVGALDPQQIFSISILSVNFFCFIVITVCYILIYSVSAASKRATAVKGEETDKRSRQLQRKITVVILTDFLCWVPFIITCLLHTTSTIDATNYYGFFSIIVLPVNSCINSLIYDSTIAQTSAIIFTKISGVVNDTISFLVSESEQNSTNINPDIEMERINRSSDASRQVASHPSEINRANNVC